MTDSPRRPTMTRGERVLIVAWAGNERQRQEKLTDEYREFPYRPNCARSARPRRWRS